MASEVTKIVDPDDGGGTDYTSLDAWEDALGGTTTGHLINDDQIAVAECRSSSGADDIIAVQINGWTTDATHYIKITGAGTDGDFPADGIFDGTKYNLALTNAYMLDIRENYVRIENIQIVATESGSSSVTAIYIAAIDSGGSDLRIDSCIIKGVCSGTGYGTGIYLGDADATVSVFNTLVYGFYILDDAGFVGIHTDGSTVNIYNCTVCNNYVGIKQSSGTANAYNCAVFNNTLDFLGTVGIDCCATDEGAGEGTNGVDISGTWDTTCFTDPEATPPDFSVQDVDSPVYNTGDGTVPDAIFTDDIIGTTRGPAVGDWDIGAFEYVTEAPPAGMAGAMTTNTGYWGW